MKFPWHILIETSKYESVVSLMSEMLTKNRAIEINNCEFKPSRRGDKMEILLKSDSKINASVKKIDVPDIDFEDDTPEAIALDTLHSKYVFAKVTVNVKVHKSSDPEMVRTGKKKSKKVWWPTTLQLRK